jgi:hypothetical protein
MRRRLADSDPEDLYLLLALREELDAALQEAVDGCRANGFSWTDVGRGAGMTRQAAQQRWGKPETTHCANCGGRVPVDKPHKVGECNYG